MNCTQSLILRQSGLVFQIGRIQLNESNGVLQVDFGKEMISRIWNVYKVRSRYEISFTTCPDLHIVNFYVFYEWLEHTRYYVTWLIRERIQEVNVYCIRLISLTVFWWSSWLMYQIYLILQQKVSLFLTHLCWRK